MINLDDLVAVKKLDKNHVYESIEKLPQQCFHAWEETKKITLPSAYKNINKIIMTGMGGSGLGARIIEAVYGLSLKYPLIRINDYNLPAWADQQTLVICSSFSGTTEETLVNAYQAQKKKTKWMAISTGGALIEYAKQCQVPYYQIVPTYNPSRQPRLAVGYSVISQLIMAQKSGVINFSKKDLDIIINHLNLVVKKSKITLITKKNPAKQLAKNLYQKIIVFVAARHLLAAAHTIKNQINENAKNFAVIFDIPELNHHLMEGLQFPKTNPKNLFFIFLDSFLYPKRIRQRLHLTYQIVNQHHIPSFLWQAEGKIPLSQVFEFIQFGGFANFYLAMLNDLDPALIPWVDYFKKQLEKIGKDFK